MNLPHPWHPVGLPQKSRGNGNKAYMVALPPRFFSLQMAGGPLGKGTPGKGFPMVAAGFPRG